MAVLGVHAEEQEAIRVVVVDEAVGAGDEHLAVAEEGVPPLSLHPLGVADDGDGNRPRNGRMCLEVPRLVFVGRLAVFVTLLVVVILAILVVAIIAILVILIVLLVGLLTVVVIVETLLASVCR